MSLDRKLLAEVMQKLAYVPPIGLPSGPPTMDPNAMVAMPPSSPPVGPPAPMPAGPPTMDPNAMAAMPLPVGPPAPMSAGPPPMDPNAMAAMPPPPMDPNAMAAMAPPAAPSGDIPMPVVLTMQDLEAILSKAKGEEKTDGESGRVTVKQLAEEFRAFKDEIMDLLGQMAMVIGVPVKEPASQEAPPPGLVGGEEASPIPPPAIPMLSVPPTANTVGVAGSDTMVPTEQKTAAAVAEKKSQEALLKILRQLNSYKS